MRSVGDVHGGSSGDKRERNLPRKRLAAGGDGSIVHGGDITVECINEDRKIGKKGTRQRNVSNGVEEMETEEICSWDMHPTDSTVYLPLTKSNSEYILSDIPFCSWECALAYATVNCRIIHYDWIYDISGKTQIGKANHPSIIDTFGGFLTIDKYRKHESEYRRECSMDEISTVTTFYSTCKDDEETVPSFKRKPFTSSYASEEIAKKLKSVQPMKKQSFLERSMKVKREQL
jgi:hypothetical protein